MAEKRNPFEGMFQIENVLTKQKLSEAKRAEAQKAYNQRLATMGPVNTMAMQFGELLGSAIRKKGGWLDENERRAARNTEVLTNGHVRAMDRIERDNIPVGSEEARKLVLQTTLEEAFSNGNMEVANAMHEQLDALENRELQLAKLRADKRNVESQIEDRRESRAIALEQLDLRKEEINAQRELAARKAVADAKGDRITAEDNLRGEVMKQLEGPANMLGQAKQVNTLLAETTPASDAAAIMSALKVFDPGARVTDQDFSTMAEAEEFVTAAWKDGQIKDATYSRLNKFFTGKTLTNKQRAELAMAVRSAARNRVMDAQDQIEFYTNLANERGLDLNAVLPAEVEDLATGMEDVSPIIVRDWNMRDEDLRKKLLGRREGAKRQLNTLPTLD